MSNSKDVLNRLYDNIELIIKQRRWYTSDVERGIGVSVGYLSRRCNMSAITLHRLSKYMNISMDDLCSCNFKEKVIEAKIEALQSELRHIRGEE